MKNTRKIFIALLVMSLLVSVFAVTASAAKTTAPTTIYLSPNANWKADGARFAVYTWDGGDQWFDMSDSNGDGVYETTIPAGIENIIFCRMNPSAAANNWNNKWNQTADLKYDGTNNHYTVTEGTWDKGGGTWSLLELGECIHAPSGAGNVITAATCTENGEISHTCSKCGEAYTSTLLAEGHKYTMGKCSVCSKIATYTIAGTGAHLGTEWTPDNTANDMTYDASTGIYTKVYTNVATGSYLFKCAQDHAWGVSYPDADKSYTVSAAGSTVTITLNGTTVTVTVEAPEVDPDHTHTWSDATCTEPQKCDCGETQGAALGHSFTGAGVCNTCSFAPLYIVAGDVMKDASENYAEGTNFFGGSIWLADDENNKLSYNPSTGNFEKVYTDVKKGEYHFKVVLNKDWSTSYGYNGTADNCYIKVDSDNSTVTIAFNPNTNIPTAKVVAHVHTEETIPAVDPTCTSAGSTAGVKCSTCGEVLTAPTEVDATGHSYESSVQAPTCTETGLTTYTCSACGDSYTEEIPLLDHTYDESEWGYKGADGHAHVCSCGAKQELLDHTPNVDAPTEDTAKYCTACEYVIEAAIGHVCDISVLKFDAEGHWYKCTGCEATSEKVAHDGGTATCTEQAKCSTCEQPYGAALGHTWTDATCTAPKTCSVCSDTEGAALGHTWTDATCTAPKTCSVCSATEGEALGHTWTDATCTAPKTCSVCSATEGEALGHTFEEGECSCGEKDPDYVPSVEDEEPIEPETELGFFDMIMKLITEFFAQILEWFKNLVPATEE